MSNVYFPFTSVGGDRKVTAFQEAQGFDMFVSSGVVEPSPGDLEDALEVTAVPDAMQVSVAIGKAVILGHRLITDAASTLSIDEGGAQGRIDVIVAESNRNNDVRAARLLVVKGTEGASPSPPALTETDAVYQIPLAWVSVPASATTLNAATITDKREASRPRGMSSEAITAVQEFPYKKAVRVATTGSNLAALSGLLTIDEVELEAGDRVLVKDQTDAEDNGIYAAASSAWVRASDFDTDGKAVSQMLIPVEQGTTLGGTIWQLITESPITLDTTELEFERFDTDDITAGNGLQRTADVISMRTPGTITPTSTNAADGSGHTHALDAGVINPTYIYKAAGENDGAAISAIVNAFLEGTGDWAGTTALTLKLVITGTLGLPTTPAYGDGSSGNPYRHFDFASTQARGARVIIDWSDARGLIFANTTWNSKRGEMIRQSGAGARIVHQGLSLSISATGASCIAYGVVAVSDSEIVLQNAYIKATGAQYAFGVYLADNGATFIDKCEIEAVGAQAGATATSASALYGNSGQALVSDCVLRSSNPTEELGAPAYIYTVRLLDGCKVSLRGCDIAAYAQGGVISKEAYAVGVSLEGSINNCYAGIDSCRILAYSCDPYGSAYGLQSTNDPRNLLHLTNSRFPVIEEEGYEQTGAINLEGYTAGAAYLIANNVFAGANSSPNIAKHSDSDPADNYQMSGNMFGVNLG